jgi:hypothetical protein
MRRGKAWLGLGIVLVAACGNQTGIVLEAAGQAGRNTVSDGVARLVYVSAYRSWCERWVQPGEGSRIEVDVRGRDLTVAPYQLLLNPDRSTDPAEPVRMFALALDANGGVLAMADFGSHPFRVGFINKYRAELAPMQAGAMSRYMGAGGCLCVPGLPWIGTPGNDACNAEIVPSYDRLVDTATCEIPDAARLDRHLRRPVCDGQDYGDPADRALPCYGEAGGCRIGLRTCVDRENVAYASDCAPPDGANELPSGALCDAYRACEATPCSDVVDCFRQKVPTSGKITCTLRARQTAAGVAPCAQDNAWSAKLDAGQVGQSCVSAIVDGTQQPPFVLGFAVPSTPGAQPLATHCPVNLVIEKIEGSLDEVPATRTFDVTIGDQRYEVELKLVRGCLDGPSLVCSG